MCVYIYTGNTAPFKHTYCTSLGGEA